MIVKVNWPKLIAELFRVIVAALSGYGAGTMS